MSKIKNVNHIKVLKINIYNTIGHVYFPAISMLTVLRVNLYIQGYRPSDRKDKIFADRTPAAVLLL